MGTRRWQWSGLVVALVASGGVLVVPTPAGAAPLDRPEDPIVITGGTIRPLLGVAPDRVAAFRWSGEAWVAVPVQVDERAMVDFGEAPGSNATPGTVGTVYGTQPIGVTVLQYTDPTTWVGPDPNPTVDGNDEIALMARDAGDQAVDVDPPAHVDAATGVELTVTDPLDPGAEGWLYLFEHDGTLDPSAGQALVDYDLGLASGDYRATYKRADGPNPEDTTVTTAAYQHHFSDRWVDDALRITVGASTGVDILDRHRNQFFPGECGRSEDTFVDGEGAFVANRLGPVRAIRSYVGANSGPLSERTHVFYEARHEIVTDLRVHAIPGIMDLLDFSPAASGMLYRNAAMAGNVTVDGAPDTVPVTHAPWQLVRGPQGSLISTLDFSGTQTFGPTAFRTYYLDDSTPPIDQCTGDGAAYGVNGFHLEQAINNTDPRFNPSDRFRGRRILTYRAPGATGADAATVADRVAHPLHVAARRWSAFPAHPFTDVPGNSWITPALDWAAFHQLVNGFAGGEFRPAGPVNRGQAVNILWHDLDEPAATSAHGFPDVPPGAFYDDALDWAREAGLVTGYADGRFGPADPVTRGQAVNLVWHAVGAPAGSAAHGFPDVPAGAFYRDALDWAHEQGLVSGYGDGTYRPRRPVSRAQFVNLLFLLAGDDAAWTAVDPLPSTVTF